MPYLDERPTVAKGRRPYFFDDPSVDKLLSILMSVAGEVSVLRERVDTHERLAEQDKLPTTNNIETFEISDELRQQRAAERAAYLKRVLRVISDELERMKKSASPTPYPEATDLE